MKLKNVVVVLFVFSCFLGLGSVVNAYNWDNTRHKNELDPTSVMVSDFNSDNQYVVNISTQMANKGYIMAPDNCYHGLLTLTNDTTNTVSFDKIAATAAAGKRSGWQLSDYQKVLNEWYLYSFAIESKGIVIPDTPVHQFPGAALIEDGNFLVSDGGYADLGQSVVLAPNESIDIYYDYSMHWESDNRTMGTQNVMLIGITLDVVETYQIETAVTNGTIDASVYDIAAGSSQTIGYQPNRGHELAEVIVDGVAVDIAAYSNEYTFNDVSQNHTIQVSYKPIRYPIEYVLDGGTNHIDNPDGYYFNVGLESFSNAVKDGHHFLGWHDAAGNNVAAISTDTTGKVTLYAKWQPIADVLPETGDNSVAMQLGIVLMVAGTISLIVRRRNNK